MASKLSSNPVHLGLGGSAVAEPEFTGELEWYGAYGERHAADGAEGRLVSMHSFSSSWNVWEMHPRGHEVVLCTAGTITLIQEIDAADSSAHQEAPTKRRIVLQPGEYAINPPGVWHTADVDTSATAVFITTGEGTEHRPRET